MTEAESKEEPLSVVDEGEAPVGAITKETYAVSCSGPFAYREPVDTFNDALEKVEYMEENAEPGTKITVVRVVDTVVRQFVVGKKRKS